jgi:hypothetical protein
VPDRQALSLARNNLGDAGVAALLAPLTQYEAALTALDLSRNTGLGAATAEALARALRRSATCGGPGRGLRRVGLSGCQLGDAALAALLPALLERDPAAQVRARGLEALAGRAAE